MMAWNPVAPSAASTASNNDNNNSDAAFFFPDFGSSVDVQDEMRRTIRSECDEIEKANAITASSVKAEERTLNQLTKDYGCAKNEMASLRRDGGDILDAETMTDDIRRGFKELFENEIVPHVTAANDDTAIVSEDEGGDEGSLSPLQQRTNRVYSHGKFLTRKNAELNNKKASLMTKAQEIKNGYKNIKAVDDDTARTLQIIESRGLDAIKAQGERNIAQLQREVEVENQRNRGVKEAIQAARANSGENAQTIAEKAKEQMTLRSEHLSKEAELTARNDALQQELSLVQAEEKKLDEELATLSGQLDFFTQNVADYEAQQQKFDEIKKEMEGVKSDIVELKTKKAFLDKVSEESSSSLKEAKKAYNKVKEAYDTIISEKAEKEKARDEAIKAAEARRTNAMKEKEILAGKIAKCHEELANQEMQDKDALHASEARVVAASKKLKIRIEQKVEARACSDKLRKEWKDSYDVQVARLRELKELSSKFEAASNAEIDRLAMLKKERIESRLEHVEKRRSDLALIEDAQKADINNIKKKLDRLRAVNKLKALIAGSKIDLSKNGTYDRFVMPNLDEIDFGCPDTDDWSQ